MYIYFRLLSGVHTALWAHELGKVYCNVSFPYKNTGLGRYFGGKDIPLLTALGEWKEKIPHPFVQA